MRCLEQIAIRGQHFIQIGSMLVVFRGSPCRVVFAAGMRSKFLQPVFFVD